MINIYESIRSDIKKSLKEKNGETRTLRTLDAAIQLKAKESKKEISNSLVIDIITKGIKQRKESIIYFKNGDRMDLVEKECVDIQILERYQPEQLKEADVVILIEKTIKEVGAISKRDMGKIMKVVVGKTKGLFDVKRVSELVKDRL